MPRGLRVTAYSPLVAAFGGMVEDSPGSGLGLAAARVAGQVERMIVILLLGLATGVLVGLLGIGGGVVLVPALVYLLRMDQHLAQGTSLFVLLPPIGLGALREYWKAGQVDLRAGILCAIGMLAGAYCGSLIAVPMSSGHLKGLFGGFLIVAALLLWRKDAEETSSSSEMKAGARG
jgi:hypothetical protein